MNSKHRNVLRWISNIVFCIGLVVFFGTNCRLRPAACHHIYKEYLSGIAVLFIIYINRFVLFPGLYVKAKYWKYVLYTTISTLAAFVFEMVLVAPDLAYATISQFPLRDAFAYLVMDGFFVLVRDTAFAMATFTGQAIFYYNDLNKNKDRVLLAEFHAIEVYTLQNNKKVLVALDDVSCCRQEKNYTRFFLSNGQSFIRYGTFKDFSELLNETYAVQVRRGTLVPYSNVVSYNSLGVVVKSIPENIIISYSENYAAHAYEILSSRIKQGVVEKSITTKKKNPPKAKTAKKKNPQMRDLLYAFIAKHPGCSASEIKRNRSVSQSTVNRILGQLKADGLIEYTGSKKTGGYRVVGTQPRDVATGTAPPQEPDPAENPE